MIKIKMTDEKIKLKMDKDTPMKMVEDFIIVSYAVIDKIGNEFGIDKNIILDDLNTNLSNLIKEGF